MRKSAILLAGVLSVVGGISMAKAGAEYRDLGFLSGCWRGGDAESVNEECWGRPEGQMMLGGSKTIAGGAVVSWEFMKIAVTNQAVVFTPFLGGKEAVPFELTQSAEGLAVFSNPAHDFPKEIRYERSGNRLAVRLTGEGEEGRPMEISYELERLVE